MKSHQRTSNEVPFGVFPPCPPALRQVELLKRTEHTSSGQMCGVVSEVALVRYMFPHLSFHTNIWSLNLFPL